MDDTDIILIAEDEFGFAELLRDVLGEAGYEVVLSINGKQALQALEQHRIGVVLADVMMPVMDGPELARAMRADDRYFDVPIVMMSSLASAVPAVAGLFDAVLHKPFSPADLMRTLRALPPRASHE